MFPEYVVRFLLELLLLAAAAIVLLLAGVLFVLLLLKELLGKLLFNDELDCPVTTLLGDAFGVTLFIFDDDDETEGTEFW